MFQFRFWDVPLTLKRCKALVRCVPIASNRTPRIRIFEAKIVYHLVAEGEPVQLNNPAAIAQYLQSAFDEHPMQEAFYAVYVDRRNRPLAGC